MTDILLHWWAAFNEIVVPAGVCPLSPTGVAQTASARIAREDWYGLFNVAVTIAAVLAIVGVLVTYYTRVMGTAFARRWRWGLLLTAVLGASVVLLLLSTADVQTFGCQFGEVVTTTPFGKALTRASVAFAQTLLFFVIASFVLTRIARITRIQPWFDHSRYPF